MNTVIGIVVWLSGIVVISICAGAMGKAKEIENEPYIWIVGIVAWPVTVIVMAIILSVCGFIKFGIYVGGVIREKVLKKTE